MNNAPDPIAAALAAPEPPAGWPPAAQALFWDAQGAWERAHALVADIDGDEAAWVHAYLHRREGDVGNARYWYARAGRPESRVSLDQERRAILSALVA